MQSELEVKAIKKRTNDTLINSTKKYGVQGNQVEGYSADKEYDVNGENAKKGGDSVGTISSHLNSNFDLTTGGDKIDKSEREKQQSYVIPGHVTYSSENYYSDADDTRIDTSLNIGQIIIY